jgi:hypothetical protein
MTAKTKLPPSPPPRLDGLVIPKAKVSELGGPAAFRKLIGERGPPTMSLPSIPHRTSAGVVPLEDGDHIVLPADIERLGNGDMQEGLAKLRALLKSK